ncbi:tail fiber domain-containing protein [Chromobacterium haemolyticum]|nr:tail fiber domain-containing protein [Chromobacterium haemolyticum]
MATDWASLAAELSKYQRIHYVTIKAFQSVFNPDADTAQIVGEDGVAREVPSWRALSGTVARIKADSFVERGQIDDGKENGDLPSGAYRVERPGDSDLMLDFALESGSSRRLQMFARYTNDLYFRVAVDTKTNWNGATARANRIWHSGNTDPVTTNTEQTISGVKNHAAQIASSPPGSSWSTWNIDRWPALQIKCPESHSAYMVWRATEWGNRHLAAMDVHGGGGPNSDVHVSLHIDGKENAHLWRGGNYSASGWIKPGELNSYMARDDGSSSLEIRNVNGAVGDYGMAAMAFHCQGTWAVKLGLRDNGFFGIGGWSAAPWRWYVDTKTGNMAAAGSVTGMSDIRLKTNIHRIDNALGKVKQLGGYTYNRLDMDCRQTGLIAQEVLGVLPEAVIETADDDKTLSVAYGNMAGLFVEAIKELSAQIDFLSHRVIELEGRKP